MEAIAYVMILAALIGLLFFAIVFREPVKITKD